MKLAYNLTEAEEDSYYIPVVIVTIKNNESARIFTVNIAE
jgi:hypothetical protein